MGSKETGIDKQKRRAKEEKERLRETLSEINENSFFESPCENQEEEEEEEGD